ncbi:hypothetical protein [Fodinibius halophilus]|uniref:DUF2059 domain-containing protein n=1 Tax=Fodinibius halophilus TaxID=1736908 RepID=A0A6M1TNQ6_9BACT|nr:hypothetical protein [Fodinibius halophilus]NGP89960.1 hypothetical protein [Fodinibius halophilus]
MIIAKKIYIRLLGLAIFMMVSGSVFAQQTDTQQWIHKARDAGINQEVLTELQNRVENNGMYAAQVKGIMETAITMANENLPSEVVIRKALEGFSKGIPGPRVLSVVNKMHKGMGKAAQIVGPWVEKPQVKEMINRQNAMTKEQFRDELTATTSKSIMQNMSPETVNEVLTQVSDRSVLAKSSPPEVIAAMGILPDLPSGSKNAKVSSKFIVGAIKGGFKAADLQKLPSAMKIAQQRSELPAASVIKGVAQQMNGGIPAKEILQNLFNGQVGGGPPGDIPPGLRNKPDNGNKGNGRGQNGN